MTNIDITINPEFSMSEMCIESVCSQMKYLFGQRLFSKRFDKQVIENHLRFLLLNKIHARKRNQHPSFSTQPRCDFS